MTVIAFRPRPRQREPLTVEEHVTGFTGTFRSPRGRAAVMDGHLRLQRLVVVPRGAFVTGVFTGELHEPDGELIGHDRRRATVPADLRPAGNGLQAVVRAMHLDLMGIDIRVAAFPVDPALAFPRRSARDRPVARRRLGHHLRGLPQ